MGLWIKTRDNGEIIEHGWLCDQCGGWNNRPAKYCPHCGKLMKGKIALVTETNVDEFIEASNHTDWIGKPTQDVYTIYWQWCIKHEYTPLNKIKFMRQVLGRFPDLKSVPYKGKRFFKETRW